MPSRSASCRRADSPGCVGGPSECGCEGKSRRWGAGKRVLAHRSAARLWRHATRSHPRNEHSCCCRCCFRCASPAAGHACFTSCIGAGRRLRTWAPPPPGPAPLCTSPPRPAPPATPPSPLALPGAPLPSCAPSVHPTLRPLAPCAANAQPRHSPIAHPRARGLRPRVLPPCSSPSTCGRMLSACFPTCASCSPRRQRRGG